MKKRLPIVLVCLVFIAFTALAAGGSVTLRAGDSVDQQAAAFAEYLGGLSDNQQREWRQALQDMLSQAPSQGAASSERIVYIVPSGEVYHSTDQCSSLRRSKTINSVILSEAVSMGRRPCKLCMGK